MPTPNSRNVIPGEVLLTVDMRHPDDAILALMSRAFESKLAATASDLDLSQALTVTLDEPAVDFAQHLIDCVEAGADRAGLRHRRMTSGAMHDAGHLAKIVPAAMIFVPCLGGVSHSVEESATLNDCAAGAQVVLNAVLAFDETFA